ncbi:cytoplasmic dynein 2 light intermediate chain 1 [Pieris rapae]|uniref:cytoplasmic dynein 2 light intermediate chain 1 n=1 Tax=Pieris rapae TaxID=64459 RepID=UPI001E27AA85|nr:cytoplasmic dynein 2 light intermediate chain 1 [Pieris rapae]
MSIPEIASQLVKNSYTELKRNSSSSTIIIVGSKNVGKSSLINTFLEKNEAPRETLVLEYSFGRKSIQKHGIEKTICHVWEYGGKLEMMKEALTAVPVEHNFYFCIMIDLNKSRSLWNVLEISLETIANNYKNPDTSPELVIIGGNYDLFKNIESELKKLICTTLRSVALLYKAHLIFYSLNEAPLVKKAKDMFYGMGFGKGISLKDKNTNYIKPLIIPKGSDSWENIGVSPANLDQIKARYISKISLEPTVTIKSNYSEVQRTHPEPILDSLAALKCEELLNLQYLDSSIKEHLSCLT